jgi:hypothetical protein
MMFPFCHRSPKIHHKQTFVTFCKKIMYCASQINSVMFLQNCHKLMQYVTFLHRHRLGLSTPSPTEAQFLLRK